MRSSSFRAMSEQAISSKRAILIGNSDGIGLALSRALLERGWSVLGISRSASKLESEGYQHRVIDVRDDAFPVAVAEALHGRAVRLVVYCAGIGEQFSPDALSQDVATFETNLMGLVRTTEQVLPQFLAQRAGALVGLSSMADAMRTAVAPAYGASKAGVSHYLESLGRALKGTDVSVMNVRLGFVDTKMAKSSFKPWLLKPEEAAERILRGALSTNPPRRLNVPRRMAVLTGLARALAT